MQEQSFVPRNAALKEIQTNMQKYFFKKKPKKQEVKLEIHINDSNEVWQKEMYDKWA